MADDLQAKAVYQLKDQHVHKILNSYMPESYEQAAVEIAVIAVDKYKQLKDIAQ